MRFSIVVPSFNQASYLADCLESLLAQNRDDLEILLYDGGSEDGTKRIIEQYTGKLAYWQSRPDNGQAAALREGFSRARGEILGWLNSDDVLLPHALEFISTAFDKDSNACMIYGDALWINEHNRIIRPKREIGFDFKIFAYGYCYIPQPAAFFTRSAYEEAGGIDPEFVTCMDYDLWHRLSRIGMIRHVPEFMAGIREHESSKTSRLPRIFREEEDRLRRKYLHCGRMQYNLIHVWQRLRRIMLRLRQSAYRKIAAPDKQRFDSFLQELRHHA